MLISVTISLKYFISISLLIAGMSVFKLYGSYFVKTEMFEYPLSINLGIIFFLLGGLISWIRSLQDKNKYT